MKTSPKELIIAALLLITGFSLSAQVTAGLRAGYNWNNISATKGIDALAPEFNSIDAFNFGAVIDIPITDHFSFQPEVAYTWKGFSLNQGLDVPLFGVDVPLDVTADSKFRYVEVPLLAKYTFGEDALKIFVLGGPTVGYATKGQIETRANVLIDINLGTIPLNLDNIGYDRFELGGMVGAGLQLEVGGFKAFADARYNHGFTEVYQVPLVEEKVRNKGFGINAGLMIPISR